MNQTSTDAGPESRISRLRDRIASISPFSLVMLGFVGFLGNAFPRLEILELFHLFWLFAFWPFVSMAVGPVERSLGRGAEDADPRAWLEMDTGWRGTFAFLLGVPLSLLNPLLFRQDAMQLLGSVVAVARHRGSLPGPETYEQSARYRLPVEGTWTVVNGSPIKEYSHSWFPATQRYAYDFVVTDDEGRSRPAGTDTSVEHYYCYDRPVLAPADGVVVDVHDDDPELGRAGGFSHPFKRNVTGNRVTIRHAEGEYSSLVHLVPGSVRVEPGDRVERGEQVGRCGHSGNSAEPHLHFQLQDHPTFEVAAGLPIRFDDVDVDTPGVDVTESTDWTDPDDGRGRSIHVGQRVTQAPDAEPDPDEEGDEPPGATATPGLGGVRTLSQVANGLAVGGYVAILAGFVVSSTSTIALGLAGLVGLALAYQIGERAWDGDGVRSESLATIGGTALAAALVGASDASSVLPAAGSSAVGAGAFGAGFTLYVAAWEYARRRSFRGNGRATAATPDGR